MLFALDISYGDVVITIVGLVVTGFIPLLWKMHAKIVKFEVQLNGMPKKVHHMSEDIVKLKATIKGCRHCADINSQDSSCG